jgi:hypothetical protein
VKARCPSHLFSLNRKLERGLWREEIFFDDLVQGESAIVQRNPARVGPGPIRCQDADGWRMALVIVTKVFLTLPQPILGALAVVVNASVPPNQKVNRASS